MGKNNEKILRVGVIGCGDIFLSHSQAYPDHLHAVLVAFYDRMRSRAENWKHHMDRYMEYVKEAAEDLEEEEDKILMKKNKIYEAEHQVYESVQDVLENVDAIDVCTPNYAHAPYAIWALKKGLSVMTEKPPARCSYETQMIVDAQNESSGYYQLNENFLWKTSVRKLNELVKQGLLGKILKMRTRLGHGGPSWGWNNHFHNPQLSGGGCLSDMGIHAIGYGYGAIGREYVVAKVQSLFMDSGTTPERKMKDGDGFNQYLMTKFMVEDHASIKVWLKNPADGNLIEWQIESSW